jgi:hypothetical protein
MKNKKLKRSYEVAVGENPLATSLTVRWSCSAMLRICVFQSVSASSSHAHWLEQVIALAFIE